MNAHKLFDLQVKTLAAKIGRGVTEEEILEQVEQDDADRFERGAVGGWQLVRATGKHKESRGIDVTKGIDQVSFWIERPDTNSLSLSKPSGRVVARAIGLSRPCHVAIGID